MKKTILITALSVASCLTGYAKTTPVVVNDVKILKSFETDMGKLAEDGQMVNTDELLPNLNKTSCDIVLPNLATTKLDNVYATAAQSVVVIGSVYKCNKCPLWHTGSVATGWVLTSDGIMVTNYHVFDGKNAAGFGIRTLDGKVAPVVEILAASAKDDIAIFRVKGEGFKPLAIAQDVGVGSSIHIIAHPDKRFFTYTAGNISRYFRKTSNVGGQIDAMAVTADFARGSSGGPVVNDLGNVVGMVSSTRSLYATTSSKKDPKRNFQMVIGNCVPADSIRKLIKNK